MGGETTRVVFRIYPAGEVIALFPDLPEVRGCVLSYQHVGQHGAADPWHVVRMTRPATAEEAAPLRRELEGVPYGYQLEVRKRMTRARGATSRAGYDAKYRRWLNLEHARQAAARDMGGA